MGCALRSPHALQKLNHIRTPLRGSFLQEINDFAHSLEEDFSVKEFLWALGMNIKHVSDDWGACLDDTALYMNIILRDLDAEHS